MRLEPTKYLGLLSLGYISVAFPTIAFFLLRYDHAAAGISRLHSLAYSLASASALVELWVFVGWVDGPFSIFRKHPHVRKLVGIVGFPLALAIVNFGLHWMIEGRIPKGRSVLLLLGLMLVVAGFAGLVSTRERPLAETTDKHVTQAKGIQKACWFALVILSGLAAGTTALSEFVRQILWEVLQNSSLVVASVALALSIGVTFGLQPWLVLRQLEDQTDSTLTQKGA